MVLPCLCALLFCSAFTSLSAAATNAHTEAASRPLSSPTPPLAWQQGATFRRAPLPAAPGASWKPGFTLLASTATGITFSNPVPEQRLINSQILPNGSGVTAGDVDGDGWCDLYFCSLKSGNRLYRNLGNWKFQDITAAAGVACADADCTGGALADIDGDGDVDLLVNTIGMGLRMFLNDGRGKFTPVRPESPLNPRHGATSLALADADGDGWLDLYIANYRSSTLMDAPNTRFNIRMDNGRPIVASINGRPLTDPEWTNRFEFAFRMNEKGGGKFAYDELGEEDAYYRNTGQGKFEHVPFTAGQFMDPGGMPLTNAPLDWGLSVMFRDLNNDGLPDLYICNDFKTPDRYYTNSGGGRFREVPPLAIRQSALSSMSIDVADLNHDGWDDLLVADMLSRDHRRRMVQRTDLKPDEWLPGTIDNRPQYARNMLYLNQGDGSYAEVAQLAGLEATDWTWAMLFLDVDMDGYEDLLIANGFVRDNMNMDAVDAYEKARSTQRGSPADVLQLRKLFPRLDTPNYAFRNDGKLRFTECGRAWGFDTPGVSQGACLADLDNDGAPDVVLNNLNGPAGIYRNNSRAPRVAVRLKGLAPNTKGIGAKITLLGGAVPSQSQQIVCGGRYLSSDDPMRAFAAGTATNKLTIQVDWRSGKRSIIPAQANWLYEIDEASAQPVSTTPKPPPLPLFTDVSAALGHQHVETTYDDFARQPGIPRKLSQSGPGLAWADVDGDGHDDLAISSGSAGGLSLFIADGAGAFKKAALNPAVSQSSNSTQVEHGAILAIPGASNSPTFLAGVLNYKQGAPAPAALAYDPASGASQPAAPVVAACTGPMAIADYDLDGRLDLFIGGRVLPGHYPEPVNSMLLKRSGTTWTNTPVSAELFKKLGLVSGAVWSDLDNDGYPELILACEWGPLRIFKNKAGTLSPYDAPLRGIDHGNITNLSQLSGWWNGVITVDLDNDGRMDIVASNWGSNTRYESQRAGGLRIYYGKFDDSGGHTSPTSVLGGWCNPASQNWVPMRRLDYAAKAMPFVRGKFTTFQSWADATIDSILQDVQPKPSFAQVNCLESMVFLNRGGHFETHPLPLEAQLSPAFAIVPADFNGDGFDDIFLSQNFFAVDVETSRLDSGRGLLLLGDGTGALRPASAIESGLRICGEQRAAAAADFDGDGRVDLAVTQNGAATKLYRNELAKPGLRVRLQGPPENPWGYGVQLRLKGGGRAGPLREVRAGGGYFSQDSPVQVMTSAFKADTLWVCWPGKKPYEMPLDSAAKQLIVRRLD